VLLARAEHTQHLDLSIGLIYTLKASLLRVAPRLIWEEICS